MLRQHLTKNTKNYCTQVSGDTLHMLEFSIQTIKEGGVRFKSKFLNAHYSNPAKTLQGKTTMSALLVNQPFTPTSALSLLHNLTQHYKFVPSWRHVGNSSSCPSPASHTLPMVLPLRWAPPVPLHKSLHWTCYLDVFIFDKSTGQGLKKERQVTSTSQGSIIPNEPGKNSPDESSWNARLKWEEQKLVITVHIFHFCIIHVHVHVRLFRTHPN